MHRLRRAPMLAFAVATTLAAAVAPSIARAGDAEIARARDAYDRGVKAETTGDHAAAARAFAEADALAPSVASLEAALESAMRADDAALGAELLERAAGRATDAGLARTVEAATQRFAHRTGKIRVECASARVCLVSVDGAARDASRAVHVVVGPHVVVVERDGARLERLVQVREGEVVGVGAEEQGAPASSGTPQATADRASRRGISPVWFFVGLGATAVAGGVTVASGVDASSKHDAFTADGCGLDGAGPRPSDCDARAEAGERAQLRTNVALGATCGLALVSGVVALLVDWSGPPPARAGTARALRPSAFFARGGGGASLEVAFP